MLLTWGGRLLLTNGMLTLGPAADECCCVGGGMDNCLELTGNLTLTVNAPGCDFDGQEVTLIDRSLGLGDDWWSGADDIWFGDCLSAFFTLTCVMIDERPVYRLVVNTSSGSTQCAFNNATFSPVVQTYPPLHLEFANQVIDQDACPCCDGAAGFPVDITFEIDPA